MTKNLGFLVLFCGSVFPGMAQTITGSITGTVTDPAGGVVPNATVTARNVDTNINTEAQTNAAGVYNLPFLPIGNYTISVKATGFKSANLNQFPLGVNQTARVDVKMEIGGISETVSVSSEA